MCKHWVSPTRNGQLHCGVKATDFYFLFFYFVFIDFTIGIPQIQEVKIWLLFWTRISEPANCLITNAYSTNIMENIVESTNLANFLSVA
jgi:hypothetical protein